MAALRMRGVVGCVIALVVVSCLIVGSCGAQTPLASSSASSAFELSSENEWQFSFDFDNTIANGMVWFEYVSSSWREIVCERRRLMRDASR